MSGVHVGITERNRLVVENLPLVGYLVSDLCARATHLSREDLASAGAVGLVLAADSFDPSTGVPFGAYARRRITGALMDELRAVDWAGRGTRKRIKALQAVSESLSAQLGRPPTEGEMAAVLGLTRDQVREALADAGRTVGPLDGATDVLVADTVAPEEVVLAEERARYIAAAIAALPQRLRHIVTEVYLEGRAVKDVAAGLGLTSSAVSQQRSEALRLLREGLELHFAEESRSGSGAALDAPGRGAGSSRRMMYLDTFAESARGLRHVAARPRTAGRLLSSPPPLDAVS